jgi:hypothetical protein
MHMKKIIMSLFVCLMASAVAMAQTEEKTKVYNKAASNSYEISLDKVPAEVKASLTAQGVEDANVVTVWKVKKEEGKIYKFKVKDGESHLKYKFKADGTMIKKESWEDQVASS